MDFLRKTFGGLESSYYFRHFFFGLLIAVFLGFAMRQHLSISNIVWLTVNTLLYPYARFVYEQVMSFIMGNNIFITSAVIMLIFKLLTMVFCWGLSIFIAPIGLVFLYFYHSKKQKEMLEE